MSEAPEGFSGLVLAWQREHGRHGLPWQGSRDPYRVWLSEIMLQQTQVSTVIGYFDRFVRQLPDVEALALASPDTVAHLWSGLGYYSRARNLHRCAQQVMERFGGRFPRSAELLETLPGIGRSTAGAIAAFCFGERVPIMDANVRRVLARVIALGDDAASPGGQRALWAAAAGRLPAGTGDDLQEQMPRYTQGMMDLGATVCLPRRPLCLVCPVQALCGARREGRQEAYPVRTRKKPKRSSESWWLLILVDPQRRVWLQRRPANGIWAGLHCPPVETDVTLVRARVPEHAEVHHLAPFRHVLTHKELHLHPVRVDCDGTFAPPGDGRWAPLSGLDAVGLPAPVRTLLEQLDRRALPVSR